MLVLCLSWGPRSGIGVVVELSALTLSLSPFLMLIVARAHLRGMTMSHGVFMTIALLSSPGSALKNLLRVTCLTISALDSWLGWSHL